MDMSKDLTIKYIWDKTWTLVKSYVKHAEAGKPFSTLSPEELRKTLDLSLDQGNTDPKDLFRRMEKIMAASPSSLNWRFLNQLFGGLEPLGLSAEILSLFANSSLYTFKAAGAQILVEAEVLKKLTVAAGFAQGEGAFVPGGSAANLAALLLARNQHFPLARDKGMGDVVAVVYTSELSHYSIQKNAGILGLGRDRVRKIAVTRDGVMDIKVLEQTICQDRDQGYVPFFINGTAGTTVRGSFDPLDKIGKLAKKYGLWFHVDGALGASLLLAKKHRQLLSGLDLADSLAWNPHKMMGLSLQTSVILTAQKGHLARSLDETADYLFQEHGEDFNPGHRSLQCGRRNDAFRLWAVWSQLGDQGWDERLNLQMDLAQTAADLIEADPLLKLSERPVSINVCFEVIGRSSEEICEALNRSGQLKIGYGEFRGQRIIRLVCVNPALKKKDLLRILKEIKSA